MLNQTSSQEIKPDWHAVEMNEDLSHWNICEADKQHIEAIYSVYFYDRNTRTFLCEITPSYHLIGLYYCVVLKSDSNLTEERADEIREKYEYASPIEDTYMHCSRVERFEKQVPYLKPGQTLDADDLTEDAVREYWQGNCPF